MTRRILTTALAMMAATPLSGCMTAAALYQHHEAEELERLRVFHPEEHAWVLAPGAPVQGRLTLTANYRYGYGSKIERMTAETLTCQNRLVWLVPDTPHMRWLMNWEYGLSPDARGDWRDGLSVSRKQAWPEPKSRDYVRQATCGEDGSFAFPDTAPGRYLLLGQITPDSERASFVPFDYVLKPVEVKVGEALTVHIRSDDWVAGPLLPD
jgi:hypothetical protein